MATWKRLGINGFVRINDWGPYDFHRDYNLTFPVQTMLDLSTGVGRADFLNPNTRLGVRVKVRSLDENSVPHALDDSPGYPNLNGWEGEVFTYLRVMR